MKVVTIPCSFDNYAYLIICQQTGEAAVVDPSEFYPVYRQLEKYKARLTAVYCTHHHADHIGGLEELRDQFDGLTICGSEKDVSRIPGLNYPLTKKSKVGIGSIAGQVLITPGHTKGSVCYSFDGHLFTGDTLFGAGCGRLFGGTPGEMYESLNEKIKNLPLATKIYFGHEYTAQNLKFAQFVEPDNVAIEERLENIATIKGLPTITTPTTLALECATNPFLRCGEEGVSAFTALRKQKDNF